MRNFEKIDTDERPKVNPRTVVNLGKCAACPLASRCAVVKLKQPEIAQREDCQNVVEAMEFSGGEDNSEVQQKLSTKEQFADDSIGTVWATNLRKKLNEELEAEQRKKIEQAAIEKRRQVEERNRQELARKQKVNQQRQLQKAQPKPQPVVRKPRFERKPKNGDTSIIGLLIDLVTGKAVSS